MSKLLAVGVCFCLTAGIAEHAFSQEPAGVDLYGDPLPKGAIARLGTTRYRIGDHAIRCLALSADGSVLAGAGYSHSITFWDTATGKPIREIDVAPMHIRGFALSPDGKRIAVAGYWFTGAGPGGGGVFGIERRVQIIDAVMEGVTRTLPAEHVTGNHHSMAFTPDGARLVSLSENNILRIEEVETGAEVLQERLPDDNSGRLALSPDGSTVAVSTGANTRRLLIVGKAPRELKPFGDKPGYGELTFSPDGKQLAAVMHDVDRPLQIWDVKTGDVVRHMTPPSGHPHGAILWTPDGKTLLAPAQVPGYWDKNVIHTWDATSGEHQGTLAAPGGGVLAMSADGKTLASSCRVSVRLWKWPSRELIAPNESAHTSAVELLATSPMGEIVSAGDDGSIRVWNAATGQHRSVMRHDRPCRGMAVSPDGGMIASSSLDDTVRLWELTSGRELYRLPGHGRLGGFRSVAFSKDGASLTSFGDDFFLRVWNPHTGKAEKENRIQPEGFELPAAGLPEIDDRLQNCALSMDGTLLACSIRYQLQAFSDFGRARRLIESFESPITALAVSSDNLCLTAIEKGGAALWDAWGAAMVREIVPLKENVDSLAFSADGKQFAAAISRPKLRIVVFDTATGAEKQTINEAPCVVRSLCFSRDGKTIVSGMVDSTAIVWRLK